jgi:transcriptional regulator with XRE-family HTH domain
MAPMTDPTAERHWICARRLRERRRQLGLTQAEVVGRVAGRGVTMTNRTLSSMENGRGLDLGRLPDLAAALDCTITYLVGLAADPTRWDPDVPLTSSTGDRRASAMPAQLPIANHNWILGPDPPPWAAPRITADRTVPPRP